MINRRGACGICCLVLFLLILPLGAREALDLARLEREIERLRDLSFRQPVRWQYKSPAEMKAYLANLIDEEMPPAKVKAAEAFLKVLDLVPQNMNLKETMNALYAEQAAGLYDPRRKVFFLSSAAAALPGFEKGEGILRQAGMLIPEIFAIHELDHALQDQNFDLERLDRRLKALDNEDRELAAQALMEGDASYVMLDYMLRAMGLNADLFFAAMMPGSSSPILDVFPQYSSAPCFLKRLLVFPYLEGMEFVKNLKRFGGWEMVNRAYRDLPLSTEQVLHWEKYASRRDPPVQVNLGCLPREIGRRWISVAENVAGEFQMSVMLEEKADGHSEAYAACGWGGDRYRVYESGQDRILLWYTVWDKTAVAEGFFARYLKFLKMRKPFLQAQKGLEGALFIGREGQRFCMVERRNDAIAIVENTPENELSHLRQALWRSTTSK